MRKPIIAGNWKMFKTRDEALEFIYQVNNDLPSRDLVDSVICAPFTVLRDLVKRQGENLRIGAQNMHFEENGAFTGEVAPIMLESLGVSYVIIGHSERRAMFNETDESCNKKLHAAFKHNLVPILCVGEYLEQREDGSWKALIKGQIEADFAGLTAEQAKELVVAYEPIWAIGTGEKPTVVNIKKAVKIIKITAKHCGYNIPVLYGGSVNADNYKEILTANVDGLLMGGVSLKLDEFIKIVKGE